MSLVGKYAGRFRIVAEIGRGGMGVVYRARDTRLGREVAVKVLDQRYINEESVRRDFIREARTAGGLQKHANIVAIFDYGTIEGLPYFVMDFVEGRPLDQLLLKDARSDWFVPRASYTNSPPRSITRIGTGSCTVTSSHTTSSSTVMITSR